MPITEFQMTILRLLKAHRNPESYVAGGIAIHRRSDSIRYSNDVDFFQESDEAVSSAFTADCQTLKDNDFAVSVTIMQPSFIRAMVTKGGLSLRLEWVRDTAFRFFPVIEDTDLGYRLHDIDLAINKITALANRTELRDIIDVLEMDEKILGLAAGCWAACGKDPGFTPELILEMISRNAIVRPELLAAENLNIKLDPVEVKYRISSLIEKARQTVARLNPKDVGCLYLNSDQSVIANLDKHPPFAGTYRHFGKLKGSWPRVL